MNKHLDQSDEALALAELLDAEWARIHEMVRLAEAMRTGDALDEEFSDRFSALNDTVIEARNGGAWAPLLAAFPKDVLDKLQALDFDLMALALSPVARPSLAPRLQSLQPQIAQSWPGLPLLQEMLMIDGAQDVARLVARLTATSPPVDAGMLRVEGKTPNQVIRPGPALIRAMLARDPELAPPPGATQSDKRGTWDELILPDPTLAQLRDFVAWVAHARRISLDWGGRQVKGPLALFSGASGTGKSFAASVLVSDLKVRTGQDWALYTLDLGRIMSKYVGETEANLNALLDSLEGRNAVLQIDEADGLLGKRGEVTDARDRYANLEVSHMLARFEQHAGPVILTTNLRTNVDSAFLRRFQLVIDFPTPDATARAQLWDVLLPPKAPRAERLDLPAIGEAVRLSGGAIYNAATYASVLASDAEAEIDMPHVARAVWAELTKDIRQVRRSELGLLAAFLPEEAS